MNSNWLFFNSQQYYSDIITHQKKLGTYLFFSEQS